jgi:hypothetical protein
MLDALLATGLSVPSLATLTPKTVPQVPALATAAATEIAPARTRVSWTTGEPKVAALTSEADHARTSRARVVRRRGLVLVGASVMLAAFILTSGFLRARKAARARATHVVTTTAAALPTPVVTAAPAVAATAAPPGSAEPAVLEVRGPDLALPAARAPVGPNKRKSGSPAAAAVAPPAPPAPSPSAAPAKTSGVAGGLQIKTNYP